MKYNLCSLDIKYIKELKDILSLGKKGLILPVTL